MINLDERFSIDADERQCILIENLTGKRKKDGVDTEGNPYKEGDKYQYNKTIGYYNCPSHALTALYRYLQREWIQNHDASMQEAGEAFGEFGEELKEWADRIERRS